MESFDLSVPTVIEPITRVIATATHTWALASPEMTYAVQTASLNSPERDLSVANIYAQDEAGTLSDVTPVPEFSSWLAALLAAAAVILSQRHRFFRRCATALQNT